MAEELPEPKNRKEEFLANIAGMDVALPEPANREEIYLNAIAENGGGGGGGSYTAGDGITIEDDTISVDTTTIQEKLTAGDNITIVDDTISATNTTYTHFTGATASTDGVQGLVPGPLAGDEDKYLKADGTWATVQTGGNYTAGDGIDISAQDVISATNTGKARVLTTADYNANSSNWSDTDPTNFNCVALWKMPAGLYTKMDNNITVYVYRGYHAGKGTPYLVTVNTNYGIGILGLKYSLLANGGASAGEFYLMNSGGVSNGTFNMFVEPPKNNLTTTESRFALDARQGKVLKDLIDSLVIKNAGAPTTSTVGTVGMLYEDTTNGKLYQCTAIDTTDPQNPVYTWTEVGGGSSVNVVQTTGTSTTDVMSQNAVTGMVFADPGVNGRIRISSQSRTIGSGGILIGSSSAQQVGSNSIAIGQSAKAASNYTLAIGHNAASEAGDSIAIGSGAWAKYKASIAIGIGSVTSAIGEMNIGSSNTTYGYNNSNYRLLSGVYDGQNNHDAATVAQGNKLMTAAPTATDAGVLGQLWTDTANMHTYQLTAIDDTTDPSNPSYTWTQRW